MHVFVMVRDSSYFSFISFLFLCFLKFEVRVKVISQMLEDSNQYEYRDYNFCIFVFNLQRVSCLKSVFWGCETSFLTK